MSENLNPTPAEKIVLDQAMIKRVGMAALALDDKGEYRLLSGFESLLGELRRIREVLNGVNDVNLSPKLNQSVYDLDIVTDALENELAGIEEGLELNRGMPCG